MSAKRISRINNFNLKIPFFNNANLCIKCDGISRQQTQNSISSLTKFARMYLSSYPIFKEKIPTTILYNKNLRRRQINSSEFCQATNTVLCLLATTIKDLPSVVGEQFLYKNQSNLQYYFSSPHPHHFADCLQ